MLWKTCAMAVALCVVAVGCSPEGESSTSSEKPQLSDDASTANEPEPSSESQPASAKLTAEEITIRVATPEQYAEVIEAHRGKVVLVDFWATWCAVCIRRFPHTVEMSETYADQGLVVVSMAVDDVEQQDAALEILKSQKAAFENLLASHGGSDESFEAYNITSGALPHYKVYGRDGSLFKSFLVDATADSTFTPEDVEQAVKAALGEK